MILMLILVKVKKKILDLKDLDINKIKEYNNTLHKNNFFSSNKEIMKLNDNNNHLYNDNKFKNSWKNRNLKEIGINGDITASQINILKISINQKIKL